MTDALGICVAWESGECVLLKEDGETVRIQWDQIVSGKPVPPRPSVRMRVTVPEAEAHAVDLWPVRVEPLGPWTLRAAPAQDGRLRKRGNSVLAFADPVGFDVAALGEQAAEFYAACGQPALAQTEPGSVAEQELLRTGWEVLEEGASRYLLAPISRIARRCARGSGSWQVSDVESERLLVASVIDDQAPLATGRATLTGNGTWAGIDALQVVPERRRRGLATAVLADLTDWAASRGASTVWLHVEEVNLEAIRFYEELGFELHHRAHYLGRPATGRSEA